MFQSHPKWRAGGRQSNNGLLSPVKLPHHEGTWFSFSVGAARGDWVRVEIEGTVKFSKCCIKFSRQKFKIVGTVDKIAAGNLSRANSRPGRTKAVEVFRFKPWSHIGVIIVKVVVRCW